MAAKIPAHQMISDSLIVSGTQGAKTITTTATLAAVSTANREPRKLLVVYNPSTTITVWWGFSDTVTTSSGFPIAPGETKSFHIGSDTSIYLIVATGTQSVRIGEAM